MRLAHPTARLKEDVLDMLGTHGVDPCAVEHRLELVSGHRILRKRGLALPSPLIRR